MSLQAHMDGAEVTEYREGDLAIPVVFRSVEQERKALSDFRNVNVYSKEGVSVPLTQIADLKMEWDYYRISRRNQEKCLTVEVKHEFLKAPELLAATKPLEAIPDHPLGLRLRPWKSSLAGCRSVSLGFSRS